MWGQDIYARVADTAEPHSRRSPVTDSSQVGDCARSPPPQDTRLGAWGSGGRAAGLSPQPLSFVQCRCCRPPFRLFLHSSFPSSHGGGGWVAVEGRAKAFILERCRRRAELGKEEKFPFPRCGPYFVTAVCGEKVVVGVRLGEWQARGVGRGLALRGNPLGSAPHPRPTPPGTLQEWFLSVTDFLSQWVQAAFQHITELDWDLAFSSRGNPAPLSTQYKSLAVMRGRAGACPGLDRYPADRGRCV